MTTTDQSPLDVSLNDSSPQARSRGPLSRRLVFDILREFASDALELNLPDGSVFRFGTKSREAEPARIHVHDERCFRRILAAGEIGFGEGYVAKDWDTGDIARVIRFFIRNIDHNPALGGSRSRRVLFNLFATVNRGRHWLRRNTRRNSRANIAEHYDLSNEFYGLWLDPTWSYSSAFFEHADQSLEAAQENKYRRLAERLDLRRGQRVLEIGCGWGGCALHLARHFDIHVTGITISQEQYGFARQRVREAGLEDRVDIRFCDYRDIRGQFDAIVSIEMLEAVGHQFLPRYFAQCHRLLKRTGQLGLQVILSPDSRYHEGRKSADWIKKHIFPGGQLPSVAAINSAINRTGDLTLQHLESFGLHYATTLHLWRDRFNQQVDKVRALGFDTPFIRKWNYYLSYCEAAFATANINVAQFVYARPNREHI